MNKPNHSFIETCNTLKRLFGYINHKNRLLLGVVLGCILLSTLGSISLSFSLKIFIDDFILPLMGQETPNYAQFNQALIVLGIIFIVGVAASFIYTRLMIRIGEQVMKTIRDEMFEHMQTLPIRYFDERSTGNIMSCYTNDADTLRQVLTQTFPQLVTASITIVIMFCAMIYLSPILTLVTLTMMVILIAIIKRIGITSGYHYMKQQENLAALNGYVEEQMTGQRIIKVFNHEEKTKKTFDQFNANLYDSVVKANVYSGIMAPIVSNVGNVQFVLVAIFAGFLSITGLSQLSLGSIAAYLQFTNSFTQPFMQIAQQFYSVVMAFAGGRRILALIDEPSEVDNGQVTLVKGGYNSTGQWQEQSESADQWAWKKPSPEGFDYIPLRGDVRFVDMTFGYDKDYPVLHQLNLYAKPGQKVAFVGATGAGKTTITNLINRFYDVDSGSIVYDGINIKDIRKDDLRKSLAIVLQDTHLFTGSIKENIRYGNPEASDEEVYAAARLAQAESFIEMLPEGYDTILSGDGETLSQGQKQLLTIARAAIANPPVLILDEATSSIDSRTEFLVQKAMDNLMKGRTVFVIAHRLSTIRNSDVIIVLDHGRIIERGDHDTLIAQKGVYYELATGMRELA